MNNNRDLIPKVTVCIVTYNQEKYIRQCLESIVEQQTKYDLDILISDDCSTDGTRDIIKEFLCSYENVSAILRDKNVGALRNLAMTHECATGDYICHVDGDDYLLPGKIEKQANILFSNKAISFACHNMKLINSEGIEISTSNSNSLPEYGGIDDLLKIGTYFQHSSVMYRRDLEFEHKDMEYIDFYVHIERATKGYIYYDSTELGVHREHSLGISKSPQMFGKLEELYELAHDRAKSLHIDENLVESSRMKKRMSFALTRLNLNDFDGYKKLICLDKNEIRFASKKHILLDCMKEISLFNKFIFFLKRRKQIKGYQN